MEIFNEMPYGYRYMTVDEVNEYRALDSDEPRWGWKRDEHVGLIPFRTSDSPHGLIRKRVCFIEFDMDHDHDEQECQWNLDLLDEANNFDWDSINYPGYSEQDDHYERFGRPEFPNEY